MLRPGFGPEEKLAMWEKRQEAKEILSGRKSISDAKHHSTSARIANGEIVEPGDLLWKIVTAIIYLSVAASIAYWAVSATTEFIATEFQKPTTTSLVLVPIAALLLGWIAYYLREWKRHWTYAVAEIAVGMAAAVQFAKPGDGLIRIIALMAGVRITVDGTKRFVDFTDLFKPEGSGAPEKADAAPQAAGRGDG